MCVPVIPDTQSGEKADSIPVIPNTQALVKLLDLFNRVHELELKRPLFACGVSAGFPSPADDYIEGKLDLNELMVANPAATFFVRVAGDSMTGAGIHHHDILVVDRSLTPAPGRVVIAVLDGEMTVKRLVSQGGQFRLRAESPDYPDILPTEESAWEIWGVVCFVIHPL